MMVSQTSRAFLIDGTAFCYRAFYAIRGLSSANGQPTNAIYGFIRMLMALRKTHRPDYLAVAFDAGKPTLRHARYESYKLNRKPMPDPLIAQLPLIKELLKAYQVPCFELEGYEAEDLLATLARRIASSQVQVLLVTADKDALQLVGPHVKVYNPHKDELTIDEGAVVERYGVPPERMVDLMALMGDPIDNIPGVPGIGEKTAAELLRKFGSLEALYERLDEVENPARREALGKFRKQVELSRELARIEPDAPISVVLEGLAVREPNWTAIRRIFRQLGFKQLLAEVDAEVPASTPMASRQIHLVKDATSSEPLRSALASTHSAALWSWPAEDQRSGILALAWTLEEAWIVPLEAKRPTWLEPLITWLASPQHPKVGHDLKQTMRWFHQLGYVVEGVSGDTMLAAYLLNPASASPTLQDAAEEWLEVRLPPVPTGDLFSEGLGAQTVAQHVCTILQLAEAFTEPLRKNQLEHLYRELELPLIAILADMEAIGIAVDQAFLASRHRQMETKLKRLSEELYALAGAQFNLNSPKQLAEVLFQQLKLPVVKRTKTGFSTDSEVLQKLAEAHPFPKKLLEYRELAKLISTYLEALPHLIDPATGRLHTSFHQTGTATGRLSSSDPNLQNIPIKTELGRQIRKAFIPGEAGWRLLAADYSQIELRILAHLSGDPQLIEAFREGRDIHRYTASLIYGTPEADVSPQMRNAMKAINYGILYGMSAHGLSKELGIAHEEAATFIEAYFARYPKVRGFLDAQIEQARREGYVQTLLGRRRYIPEVNSPDPIVQQFGERMAVNAPIQGTAADLIKRAMVQLAAALKHKGLASRMLLQVHDELVFECPPEEAEPLALLVRQIMEGAIALAVPLEVVVKQGPNWLEMKEL